MMARLVLCAFALLVTGGLADFNPKAYPQKKVDNVFLKHQTDLMFLFYHIYEPIYEPEVKSVAETWSWEKNIDHFTNVTAVKIFAELWEFGVLPKRTPFAILNQQHQFEAVSFFHVLFSAKDYETFYKTAVWGRQYLNEELFVFTYSVAILNRPDTQGIIIPPIYEIFPWYFNNAEIMATAQRITTHGFKFVDHYKSTYIWDHNVVIKANMTWWPYFTNEETKVSYFTHDKAANSFYYNYYLTYPQWLSSETVPLKNDRRGEWFWFMHKQLLARYYMERLSNGLGEIPELSWWKPVKSGYMSCLVYPSGIPFPMRPDNFWVKEGMYISLIQKVNDYESRVRDAIDQGYIVNSVGEHINILKPEAIDILGSLIEANADSPNVEFYKDFISHWKVLLGNSQVQKPYYYEGYEVPFVLPSVLEHYQTAMRDPAFYMITKHWLRMVSTWQHRLPLYKREELALPTVTIKEVEVDKLVTYFENSYLNVTNALFLSEAHKWDEHVSVVVERPQLNHKKFQVRVKVNSENAKTVVVKFFLAPKYDSMGNEISMHDNSENFFLFDSFKYDLPQGEHIIKRHPAEDPLLAYEPINSQEVYWAAKGALEGKREFMLDQTMRMDGWPLRLLLPKGHVGGMPFVLVVHITEYRAPVKPIASNFDPIVSLGLGSGTRWPAEPFGYPFNRPVYEWQVKGLTNFYQKDVQVFHKHTPEIFVPHFE